MLVGDNHEDKPWQGWVVAGQSSAAAPHNDSLCSRGTLGLARLMFRT